MMRHHEDGSMTVPTTPTIACIGECMIELTQAGPGRHALGFGGDTLNTATYCARLGIAVDYITALGDDPWSDEMIAGWQAEGINTRHVLRVAGKLPGLYIIKTSDDGERSFHYWRENSAARLLLSRPETAAMLDTLLNYDLIYLSGITLSLYDADGRQRLMQGLRRVRDSGGRVAFDANFRPRGWPDRDAAKRAYHDVFAVSDIVLASVEDLDMLFGEAEAMDVLDRLREPELVLKFVEPSCRVRATGVDQIVLARPVDRVVDTTAAGDSFAAAYLAARLTGAGPVEAAQAGHRLAGTVVLHPGAIIPRAAMPPQA
jgi:2-dehydro-3-deoxygluconokinase